MPPDSSASQKRAKLQAGIDTLGIDCTTEQLDLLLAYLNMLERWNKAYNLTAIRDPEQMINLHLLDSLALQPHVADKNLIDVGTGPACRVYPWPLCTPINTSRC